MVKTQAEGSLYHETFYQTHGPIHSYLTEGIGEDFIPGTIDLDLIDDIVVVRDRDAFQMTRRLVEQEALLVGGSSGAAVFAALQIAQTLAKKAVVVALLPDSGRSYLSSIFNDEWRAP